MAGLAVLAMAGTAAGGLLLLDAGRAGSMSRLTAAVAAMAVGAPVRLGAVPAGGMPVSLHGLVDVMPLGVTAVGAVVLGVLLLRRGRDGLLTRGLSATAVFAAVMGAVAGAGRGSLNLPAGGATSVVESAGCPSGGGLPGGGLPGGGLPGGAGRALEAGFAVAVGPAVIGAVVGAVAVVGLCLVAARFPTVTAGARALRWPVAGAVVTGLVAAWVVGGPVAAGAAVMAFPVVLLGLAGPWAVHADGMLSCVLDGGRSLPSGVPFVLLSGAVVVGLGIAVAAGTGRHRRGGPLRRAAVQAIWLAAAAGLLLVVLAVLARASVGLSAQAFILSLPLLDLRVAADPWLASAGGLGAGAVSGFAGSLLVDGFVGWRPWKR
ncbi:hypothetical protein [Paractinoplanes maris]|uniref:hypothetical protein n=1 Tax=Paractinoplanes maris TaxID=1734446 RepID=UPI0020210086|nr:hypothetical protein [Actinoplanes maris]